VTKQILQFSTTRHPLVPPSAKGFTEGEESVVSFLRAEGETDSGIEAILDHPGPTGIRASGWTNTVAMRGGYEPSLTATAYTASSQVLRMTSGLTYPRTFSEQAKYRSRRH